MIMIRFPYMKQSSCNDQVVGFKVQGSGLTAREKAETEEKSDLYRKHCCSMRPDTSSRRDDKSRNFQEISLFNRGNDVASIAQCASES